ncbi:GtrA family protein [Oerskovia sp. NPDC056781]|uniref:GtrA family protein n=1 Tax=Oerskovia rustica TaxID=2762237 RepID=A0ABR8RME0_9CELL|nr:GtrA family protein [Oerskovia rustica]MBD7948921.1 GtrA family protein [Oerskovia rustica]
MKYISIGGLCFVIDAGLLWFCTGVLGWDVWLGATIGYWTGVLVNFTLNRTVMAREGGNLLRQTTRYGILLGFNYLVTLAFLHLTAMLGMPVVAGKTVIVAASTCWNYLLYRFWIFV